MKISRLSKLASAVFILLFFCINAKAQLQFVENKGQWNPRINYKADIDAGAVFLEPGSFMVYRYNADDLKYLQDQMHPPYTESTKGNAAAKSTAAKLVAPPSSGVNHLRSHAYRVNFIGASPKAVLAPDKALNTYNNYFLGNDKSKWKGECKIYQAVTYQNVYPNIDVRYYSDGGSLKYDFIVRPGGKVSDIMLRYDGVNKLEVRNKELIIKTSIGETKELYPYSYQVQGGTRKTIECKYVVKDSTVRFKIDDYSATETLVIDPRLVFASLTGSTSDNWGYTATPGPDGSFFAAGISFGTGYPVSPGAFDQTWNNGVQEDVLPHDIGLIKLSPDGSSRLYGTYIGGSGNEQPHSMICDAEGNLYLAGRSNSTDYPYVNLQGGGSYDIVVTKLNAAGSAILGSFKIGGTGIDGVNIRKKFEAPTGAEATRRNYGDDARSEIILDGGGNVLVVSCTQSPGFFTTPNAFQRTYGGGFQDGVIMKFNNNLSQILFSSFFGGPGVDACFVLSISPVNGNIYVAGGTTSTSLPGNTSGALYPNYMGGITDGFVTQIDPTGSNIIRTTYMGTTGDDLVYGIQFDRFGFPYVTGTTTGAWPILNAPYNNPTGKQFIGKLQPDLSAFVYSTAFGTGAPAPNISITAFLVDRCQNVYVAGWGASFNSAEGFPNAGTRGLPVTSDAVKSTTDGDDFYFFVLEKNANSQLFGSFYGQNGGFADHVDGGTSRFDANGIIYEAICANCGGRGGGNGPAISFPVTGGVWGPRNGSTGCNEAMVKIEMNFSGVNASVRASINGVLDTVGCVPLDVVTIFHLP